MHVSTLFSLSKEITHCWSPDLLGSLGAMIMQILSKGKHLVSSLYRAYTFLQRTGRQKHVSIWERNYDWATARSSQVTTQKLQARTNSTRTCVRSLKERAEGSPEEALDLGEESRWKPILGNSVTQNKVDIDRINVIHSGLQFPQVIFCASINYKDTLYFSRN